MLLGILFNVLKLQNGMGWISLSAYWQSVISGIFLLAVVLIQARLSQGGRPGDYPWKIDVRFGIFQRHRPGIGLQREVPLRLRWPRRDRPRLGVRMLIAPTAALFPNPARLARSGAGECQNAGRSESRCMVPLPLHGLGGGEDRGTMVTLNPGPGCFRPLIETPATLRAQFGAKSGQPTYTAVELGPTCLWLRFSGPLSAFRRSRVSRSGGREKSR